MNVRRISKTTAISLPPALYREALRMAKAKGMTNSELFQEALRRYRKDEDEWEGLLAYGRRKAVGTGIRKEGDVERLIDVSRA